MLLFGILSLIIVLVTAALNAAEVRVAQHRTTLYPGTSDDKLPKWWPSQKHLNIIIVIFNWIMVVASLTNIIWLIATNNMSYILNFAAFGLVCWIVGNVLGVVITSAIITTRGKKNGINVIRECL